MRGVVGIAVYNLGQSVNEGGEDCCLATARRGAHADARPSIPQRLEDGLDAVELVRPQSELAIVRRGCCPVGCLCFELFEVEFVRATVRLVQLELVHLAHQGREQSA